jgi:hypothetical protein
MKKIFMTILGLCVFVYAFAQKPVVVIDYFTSASAKQSGVSALRNHVIAGIAETNRGNLIDVESEASLKLEVNRRSSELALGDQTARMGKMRTLGANYILTGVVSSVSAEKQTIHGVTFYSGNVVYSLKVMDAENGTIIGAETYTYSGVAGGVANSSESAITTTLEKAQRDMETFVSKYFKTEGVILEMGQMKGGKAKDCYISLGASSGIEEGQKFEVYEVKTIAGREARSQIGMLVVKEVVADDLSHCKFSSGAKEILEAFQAGHELRVVSKAKSDALRKAGNFIGGIL